MNDSMLNKQKFKDFAANHCSYNLTCFPQHIGSWLLEADQLHQLQNLTRLLAAVKK